MPTRVATLTRRSTDEQHQPFSIELQDTKLGAYIKSQVTVQGRGAALRLA